MTLDVSDVTVAPPAMKVTKQQMADAQVPHIYRDFCAHLWIPLEKCRRDNLFAPWKCGDERHGYEECQYREYVRRMKIAELKKRQQADE
ncbi:NADH-ubiquinone oxidoreductase B18 subunit-domain-containing protein [Catenaria anguillulae PL171]|uniref:NADH dehydrogenase [ubiquinone] 1 beta subcomplex subunit 7 n=1 Tax=Catenaria anguillulae PL171 TaxID=765915 RepID=A0A1Y2HXV7_9FUNG|nr:NADH-ubiquinone oxidoreductase B18 subunit-domain-containing protein [Catenaria anguillulae PL171]